MSREPKLGLRLLGLGVAAVALVANGEATGTSPLPGRMSRAATLLYRWEDGFAGTSPSQRLSIDGAVETLVSSCAIAHSLGADPTREWATRLYGEDTDGRRAFDAVLGMLDGDYSQLVGLYAAVHFGGKDRTDWGAIAERLGALASENLDMTVSEEERRRWHDVAALLRLPTIVEGAMREAATQAMQGFSAAPEAARRAACKAFLSLDTSKSRALQDRMRSLPLRLERLLIEKKLTDPCLAEFLIDLTPYPGKKASYAWRLRNMGLVEQAEYAQKQAATGAPGDPRLAGGRVQSMVNSGKGAEAAEEAEKTMAEMPYPGRREFRRKYYMQLVQQSRYAEIIERYERSGRAPPPQLMRHRTNLPTLGHEKSKLTSLASAESANAEPWLALGDMHTVEKAMDEAAVAYTKALALAKEPLVVYMAWVGLAESAPKRAWDAVDELKNVLDSGAVPRGEVVEAIFLTGAAIGEVDAAVELALAASKDEGGETKDEGGETKDEGGRMKDEEGRAGRGGEAVMTIAGALLWSEGRKEEARTMFATQHADFAVNELVGMLAQLGGKGLDEWPETRRSLAASRDEGGRMRDEGEDRSLRPRPWQGCVPDGLKQKALKTVNARLAELPGWRLAAECAVEALPNVTLSQTPGPVLELIFDHAPAEPTDEGLALIARCTDACLAWIDAHPRAGGGLELLLEAPMQPLRGKHKNEALWPEAKRLFVACVNRAGRRKDIEIEDVRTPIRAFLRFAQKAGWPEEDMADVEGVVSQHYPKLVK